MTSIVVCNECNLILGVVTGTGTAPKRASHKVGEGDDAKIHDSSTTLEVDDEPEGDDAAMWLKWGAKVVREMGRG